MLDRCLAHTHAMMKPCPQLGGGAAGVTYCLSSFRSFFLGHLSIMRKHGAKEFMFDTIERWYGCMIPPLISNTYNLLSTACRYKECGPVFKFWGLHKPIVIALDPECIKVRKEIALLEHY